MVKLNPGGLDFLILAALAQRAAPQHGYALIRTLREQSRGYFDLQEGSVYPILHELEQQGRVRSGWATENGRRRRTYRLTQAGRELLGAKRVQWVEYSQAIGLVIDEHR